MLLHSIVFSARCARVQAEFLAASADDPEPAPETEVCG